MRLKHVHRKCIGRDILQRREHVVDKEQRAQQRDVVRQVGNEQHGDEQRNHACLSDEDPRSPTAQFGYLEPVDDGAPQELEGPRQRSEREQIGKVAGVCTLCSKEGHHRDGDEAPRDALSDIERREGDDTGPVTVHQRFTVGGGFAFNDFGFGLTEIQVEMEAISLLGRHVANQTHHRKNPGCKQEQRQGTVPDSKGGGIVPVFVENGEIEHQQTDHRGDFFAVVVVGTECTVEGFCVHGEAQVVGAKRFLTEGQLGFNLALGHPFNHTRKERLIVPREVHIMGTGVLTRCREVPLAFG